VHFVQSIMRYATWAAEIRPGLWLGSGHAASKKDELIERGVFHVLNVADDVDNFHKDDSRFVYHNLHVADFGADKGILRVFPEAFEFLDARKAANEPVLVHCAAGANRSVTIVIAFLMHSENISLRQAFADVKKERKGACPQKDNRFQLLEFERQSFGTTSVTEDEIYFL
jgi:protein-tyrosine phosphatase